jgi:hypothetical protein
MLSLDSKLYAPPKRNREEGSSYVWLVEDQAGREKRMTSELNFTLFPAEAQELGLEQVDEKLTFYYGPQGNIKAAPRTLRVYGAIYLGPIISRLMNFSLNSCASEVKSSKPSEKGNQLREADDFINACVQEFLQMKDKHGWED